MALQEAAIKGTGFVFLPIIASILTTCVAFVPLLFFTARFGAMVKFIPLIVFFMLGASLLESLFILPGHMTLPLGPVRDLSKRHWFDKWEKFYGKIIEKILPRKKIIFIIFIALLVLASFIASAKMKFVMFPGEETRSINLTAEAPPGSTRHETAKLAQSLEDIIAQYIGKEVVGFRSQIARSRRGSVAQENKMRMRIEILPKEKRKKSADVLISEWKNKFKTVDSIDNIKLSKTRHGQDSSSPIEILVKENNDDLRKNISDKLAKELEKHSSLKNIEIDRPILNPEYRIKLNRDKIRRLAISPSDVAKTLRASLEGKILYDFAGDDEEVYVRITTVEGAKNDINKVLDIPVENASKYLVPLKDIVSVEEIAKPNSIEREDLKRITRIYADIKLGVNQTPLEVAKYFENNIFGDLVSKHPTTILEFAGEVKDTRESQNDFTFAIIMAIVLIYIILTLLLNSLYKPLIIMLAIPFGLVGIILAFWFHGIFMYGFFAMIGALGLAGVVVNDAIIMLIKLDKEFDSSLPRTELYKQIGDIAQTRLRAVVLTTLTTVVGIIPTAYGWAGYDAMLAQMMMALAWGLLFGTLITLILIPSIYAVTQDIKYRIKHV